MRRYTNEAFVLMIFVLTVSWVGCGSKTPPAPVVEPAKTPEGMEVQVPEWFANPPQDPNYLYSPATGTSTREIKMAINNAIQAGRAELSRQIATKVSAMMKRFQEEVGADEDAEFLSMVTDVSKAVSSEVISGSRAAKQKVLKESVGYRAYVLMELPIGMANAALMEKIKANKNMYTRFRASQAFQELEDEVEKYEQFKKEQQGSEAP